MDVRAREIQYLKGVGPARAELFGKLGIHTVGELLTHFPRGYEDTTQTVDIREAPIGQDCTIRAVVKTNVTTARIRKNMTLYRVRIADATGEMLLTFFNNRYIETLLKQGETYTFRGKVGGTLLRKEMASPIFEAEGRLRPIYPQTKGLDSRAIERAVIQALSLLPEKMDDPLPKPLRKRYELCGYKDALRFIHQPEDLEQVRSARGRLAFEELLTLQLGMLLLKGRSRDKTGAQIQDADVAPFYNTLPYELTGAQKRTVSEALSDMQKDTPMRRLVQGDVGSGKTAVAAALCYACAKNGMQAAMMVPTEILAQQHYDNLCALFAKCGVTAGILTGSMPAAEKKRVRRLLAAGELDFVVGTHALLSDDVTFARLGLVITDEQHRFGVEQRSALALKADNPHILIMSATPIPRTLSLIIYGDLDISVIDELPKNRLPVETYAVGEKMRARVYRFIKQHIDAGEQAYIVCPLIEEGDSGLLAATQYYEQLCAGPFFGYHVGLLHGRMKGAEKEEIMRRFTAGEISVLVSTTVIEVGVDVKNATLMVIENAERFGLSALHQLRGRVGRGSLQSYCILLSSAKGKEAKARLSVMTRTNDGFVIANEDLRQRGPGDFFGSRQHGLPNLKVADMLTDVAVLKEAGDCAQEILQDDPALAKDRHAGLKQAVDALFAHVGDGGLN